MCVVPQLMDRAENAVGAVLTTHVPVLALYTEAAATCMVPGVPPVCVAARTGCARAVHATIMAPLPAGRRLAGTRALWPQVKAAICMRAEMVMSTNVTATAIGVKPARMVLIRQNVRAKPLQTAKRQTAKLQTAKHKNPLTGKNPKARQNAGNNISHPSASIVLIKPDGPGTNGCNAITAIKEIAAAVLIGDLIVDLIAVIAVVVSREEAEAGAGVS